MKLKTVLIHLSIFTCALPGLFAQEPPHSFSQPQADWYFSVGSRFIFSGAKAKFENLGTITTQAPSLEAGVNRVYHDGYVNADEEREAESDPNTVVSGGRYKTYIEDEDGNLVQTGDFLSYDATKTRSWGYKNSEQANGGNIDFNTYSSVSNGGSVAGDQSLAGEVEVQFAKVFYRLNPRMQVSLMGSFGLTDISVESNGSVDADLHTIIHSYSLFGATAPTPPYNGPSYEDLDLDPSDPDNETIPSGRETTTPISQEHVGTSNRTTAGGAQVNGIWKINGAYATVRLGPSLHARLSDRFQIRLSAGLSTHFASTRFKYEESLKIDGQATNLIKKSNDDDSSKVLFGYFAEANLESWFNEKTGIFLGIHHEEVGDYQQNLDGRLAKISLGGSTGIRTGIVFRY